MNNFIKNALITSLPLLILAILEGYFFPRDQFTYRIWESISVNMFGDVFPGPFYPLKDVTLNETTDQNRYGPKTIRNRWATDIYGQRNVRIPKSDEEYGLIIGDSNIIGSSLNQNEMLSESLKRKTGILWVNLGYEYVEPWRHPITKNHPPKAIIYQLKRGSFVLLNKLGGRSSDPISCSRFLWRILEPIDHASKFAAINKLRSLLRVPTARFSDQLFESAHLKLALNTVQHAMCRLQDREATSIVNKKPVDILMEYADYCKKNKIVFIILVLPDTFRHADVDIAKIQATKGVKVIGFMPTPDYPNGADLGSFWQKKDSHWSVEGVEKTSDKIVEQLELKEKRCYKKGKNKMTFTEKE